MDDLVGTVHTSKDNGEYTVIDKIDNDTYRIRFNNTGFEINVERKAIERNYKIRDKFLPTIHGVAAVGYGNRLDNEKMYNAWSDMIRRCYNQNFESYSNYGGAGVTVDPRWLRFDLFLEDAVNLPGYADMINNPHITYSLDKDILQQNCTNKVYGPHTCMWVPISINAYQALNDRLSKNVIPYTGINLTHGNTYNVRLRINGEKKNFGNFDSLPHAISMSNHLFNIYKKPIRNQDDPGYSLIECLHHRSTVHPLKQLYEVVDPSKG